MRHRGRGAGARWLLPDSLLANTQDPRGDGYIWAASNVPQLNATLPIPALFTEYTGWWVQAWAHQTIAYQDSAFGSATWQTAKPAVDYLTTQTNAQGLLELNLLNGANWSYSVIRVPLKAYNDLWLLATRRAFREASAFLGQDPGVDPSRLFDGAEGHNKKVWPVMNYFEVLGRLRWGDGVGALELMKRTWGTMLDAGPGTTFWEGKLDPGESDPALSMAHTWSTGITSLLGLDAVGYRVELDGTVVLRPTSLPIERYRTRIPGLTPVTADVTYTTAYQRLEVSEGAALVVEVTDFAAQKLWLANAELRRDDPRVKAVDGRLRISLTAPFRLDFVPTPRL